VTASRHDAPRAARIAFAAFAVIVLWQILTVRYTYGGNASGLFCIAPRMPVPEAIRNERLYLFEGTNGYDGQIFHLIAHDPWMWRGFDLAIFGPGFRYQRILVPSLAWALALGRDEWVHTAYFAVVDLFLFFGVYWVARFALRVHMPPVWGLLFLFNPGTIASFERMTVDGPALALAAGFVFYASSGEHRKAIILLAFAALTREASLLLISAYCLVLLYRGRYVLCSWAAASALPYLVWRTYVMRRGTSIQVSDFMSWVPLSGWADRLLRPESYPLPAFQNAIAIGADYVAMAAMTLALAVAMRLAWKKAWDVLPAAIYTFALLMVFMNSRQIWEDVWGFGRIFAALILFTAMVELPKRPWLSVLPTALLALRLSIYFARPALAVLRGLF